MIQRRREEWYLYILECRDGSYYTGITNDVVRRLELHKRGKASKYTRSRRPVKVIHAEICESRSDALRNEAAVKKMTRAKKEEYVRRHGKGTD